MNFRYLIGLSFRGESYTAVERWYRPWWMSHRWIDYRTEFIFEEWIIPPQIVIRCIPEHGFPRCRLVFSVRDICWYPRFVSASFQLDRSGRICFSTIQVERNFAARIFWPSHIDLCSGRWARRCGRRISDSLCDIRDADGQRPRCEGYCVLCGRIIYCILWFVTQRMTYSWDVRSAWDVTLPGEYSLR